MPPIDIQFWESIANILEAIFLIISVVFIWLQIRERNRLTRIANKHTFFQLSSPFMMQLAQDRHFAELWFKGIKQYEAMDEVDQFRYHQLLFWLLTLYDDMYYQKQNDLMDEQMSRGWEVEMQYFLRDHQLKRFWNDEMKAMFRPDFQQLVDQKLQSI
jgi:hypothetical protein